MRNFFDSIRLPANAGPTRRQALRVLGLGSVILGLDIAPGSARGQADATDNVLTESAVLARSGYSGRRECRRRYHHCRIFRLQLPVLPQGRPGVAPGGTGRRQGQAGLQGLAGARPGVGRRGADGAGGEIPGQIRRRPRCTDGDRVETDRAPDPRAARRCRHRCRPRRQRPRKPMPRRSTRSWSATTIRPPRSASRARRRSSSANSACRAR